MQIIVLYVIGMLLCIIARVFDKKYNKGEFGTLFFTTIWTISPIAVPLVAVAAVIILVGIIIKKCSEMIYSHL